MLQKVAKIATLNEDEAVIIEALTKVARSTIEVAEETEMTATMNDRESEVANAVEAIHLTW